MLQVTNGHGDLVLPSREGYRLRREGFPAQRSVQFSQEAWQSRCEFFVQSRLSDVSYRSSLTAQEFSECGIRALHHIRDLAQANSNQCPTLYQVLASLARDPNIGGVSTPKFEQTVRVLHSKWFTSSILGTPLIIGSEKNLYDSVTKRLDGNSGEYQGMSIVSAIYQFSQKNKNELFTSSSVLSTLHLEANRINAARLISAAFQLLAQCGHLIRHPDHLEPQNDRMVSVWSSASYKWKKPAISNPELAVLNHAADENRGWMFELYANVKGDKSIFCHHTIIAAARRLDARGLVKLKETFMSDDRFRPNGDRQYKKVELTERAKPIVLPWSKVDIGGQLTRDNYDTLRTLLVERRALTTVRSTHSNNAATSKMDSTRCAGG